MNALELLVATLFSSLVGSLHCVGMCSPFAMLAMGPSNAETKPAYRAARLMSYHFGRLTTYLFMGALVAAASFTFQMAVGGFASSKWMGWGVGLLMIGLGVMRLFKSIGSATKPVKHSDWVLGWTRSIVSLRKRYTGGPVWLASFLWGFSSTFLPCGWLYLFVLASAAASTPWMTIGMMVAFWVGTLPLLTAAAWSWSMVTPRWRFLVQPIAALCVIAFGFYTLLHRSQVDTSSIAIEKPTIQQIRDAMNSGLPCCTGVTSRAQLLPKAKSTSPAADKYGTVGFLGGHDAGNP